MVSWKKVGMGVAAATVGAAAFGAVHFMFLAPQFGVGEFMGIPLNVVLPFLLGTLGIIGTMSVGKKWGSTVKDIMMAGSATVIGVGVSQYAGWIGPATTSARARRPVAARLPSVSTVRAMPARITSAARPVAGVKMI